MNPHAKELERIINDDRSLMMSSRLRIQLVVNELNSEQLRTVARMQREAVELDRRGQRAVLNARILLVLACIGVGLVLLSVYLGQ